MLDGEGELVTIAGSARVEVAVAPGVQLGAASQGLAGTQMGGAFSCVVHENDGGLVSALQTTQVVEKRRNFGGDVFVSCDRRRYVTGECRGRENSQHAASEGEQR